MAPAAPRLIAIVGPTAAGKSALALRLAAEVPAEIVCCDSVQVYRGFDIGSAKATPEERARVPHHMLDLVPPDGDFSAAEYSRLARRALADRHHRNHRGDAEDDAEHAQRRAQLVAAERLGRDVQELAKLSEVEGHGHLRAG